MNWQNLNSVEQLRSIKESSKQNPVLIFKHSTRCAISRTALDRLQRNWKPDEMKFVEPFYLDLLKYPDVSDQVARDFGVPHESPQVLLIRDGKAVYDRSHFEIDYKDILADVLANPVPEERNVRS
ncbi:MAG TPA: bacillithiol system redox-active protein YtxJ [Cyclobacteriaceae bacterium]|nr:bacillithiol system redox-active protein YtxJ [Cyclobacteriaceae bacterium]